MKNGKETKTIKKPSLYIAMPCYDMVKIQTMISMVKLVAQLTQAGIKMEVNTMKSPYIAYARNILTARFMESEYDYLLFIDSDVEFEPESVVRMLVAKKRIICTPYRVKAEKLDKHIYTVEFKDPKNIPMMPGGLVELEAGPTGLMLIDRVVFERIITNHPELKIKNKATPTADKSHEFYYNFFDFGFDEGYSTGEDISFCRLARGNDFTIYANTESTTRHHGSWAWEGKFKESLNG